MRNSRRRGDIGEGREPQTRMASEDEEWGRWRYIRRVLLASERARGARCVSAAAAVARGYFNGAGDEGRNSREEAISKAMLSSKYLTDQPRGEPAIELHVSVNLGRSPSRGRAKPA